MKKFRTKSIKEKDRLAERKILPTSVEGKEFVYLLEEDVSIEDILRVDVVTSTEKKEKKSSKKSSSKKRK